MEEEAHLDTDHQDMDHLDMVLQDTEPQIQSALLQVATLVQVQAHLLDFHQAQAQAHTLVETEAAVLSEAVQVHQSVLQAHTAQEVAGEPHLSALAALAAPDQLLDHTAQVDRADVWSAQALHSTQEVHHSALVVLDRFQTPTAVDQLEIS